MARPPKEINWDLVEKLIECNCSGVQIAAKFRIQDDTLYRRFKEKYGCSFQDYHPSSTKAGEADILLMQHMKALNNSAPGNTQMLIHLGKVRLGQKEPESNLFLAPKEKDIEKDHIIMQQANRIAELEANADKSQTE